MKKLIKVMKALSDPGRVKMVKMLAVKEMCVCEIQAALELSQPTISKHLKVLEEAGLVASRKDKLWVNYNLTDGDDSTYARDVLEKMSTWLEKDPEIKTLKKKLKKISRDNLKKC